MNFNFTLPEKPTHALSDFEFVHDPKTRSSKLGSGSFASVKLAREIKTNKFHAIKMIDVTPSKFTPTNAHNLKTEINIHKGLDHFNIIKFHGCFHKDSYVYIVLDYAERGNLYSYIHKKKIPPPENEIFKYFYQTCLAIDYLHKNNIMHRDLKPENLLLDKDYNIKLCDFGWSTQNINDKRLTFCGTYEYMAPEIINKIPYDYRIDIWSLGILLYELFHLEAPYKGRNLTEITRSQSRKTFNLSSGVNPEAKDLIVQILKMNPSERPELNDILNHPWVLGHISRRDQHELNLQRIFSARSLQIETEEDNRSITQRIPETTKSCSSLVFETNGVNQGIQTSEYFANQPPSTGLVTKHQVTALSSSRSHTRDPSTATIEDKNSTCQTEIPAIQLHSKTKSEIVNKPNIFLKDHFSTHSVKFSTNSPSIQHMLELSGENTVSPKNESHVSPKKENTEFKYFSNARKQAKQKDTALGLPLTPTYKFSRTHSSAFLISLDNRELEVKSSKQNSIYKLNLSPAIEEGALTHKKSSSAIQKSITKKESKTKIKTGHLPQPQKEIVQTTLKSPKGKTHNLKISLDLRSNPIDKSKKGSLADIFTPRTNKSGLKLLGSPKTCRNILQNVPKTLRDNASPANVLASNKKNKENTCRIVKVQIKSPIKLNRFGTPRSNSISKPMNSESAEFVKVNDSRSKIVRELRKRTEEK